MLIEADHGEAQIGEGLWRDRVEIRDHEIDAATAFWNAEGVELQQMGVPIREFRVDQFGAPRYPELVVATSRNSCSGAHAFIEGLARGYAILGNNPSAALEDLFSEVPGLDRHSQSAQLAELTAANAFLARGATGSASSELDPARAGAWLEWATSHHLVDDAATAEIDPGFHPAAAGCV